MIEWVRTVFEQTGYRPAVLPLAFLLGVLSAIASSCCTVLIMGAVIGYSGAQKDRERRAVLFTTLFFMLGIIISLVILGWVAGFIGQAAQSTLGKYWKLLTGLIVIVLGLATLRLLPFKLTPKTSNNKALPKGLLGTALFGLTLGGGIIACSLWCNPGICIVFGGAVLQGRPGWAMAILGVYAVGFSLPLAAIMLGVSFGKMVIKAKRFDTVVRIAAGVLLIAAGFYLLATL